jgi:cytochrome P450
VQELLRQDPTGPYLDLVIAEVFQLILPHSLRLTILLLFSSIAFILVMQVLRLYPLFGMTHRIVSKDIVAPDGSVFPAGTGTYQSHLRFLIVEKYIECILLRKYIIVVNSSRCVDLPICSLSRYHTHQRYITVLCFNHLAHHTSDQYERPLTFEPERWLHMDKKTANYIPFGIKEARSCPAQHLATTWMREIAFE